MAVFDRPNGQVWSSQVTITALPDTGETMMSPEGAEVEAELGGVILIEVTDMK